MAAQYIIDEELGNRILEILQEQPYAKVADLIDGMRKLKQVRVVEK